MLIDGVQPSNARKRSKRRKNAAENNDVTSSDCGHGEVKGRFKLWWRWRKTVNKTMSMAAIAALSVLVDGLGR